ncbi:hypothetical protein AAG747_28735 [Rapidithrix thailandica]|uniref:Uncharacterized protein n=1 Tax=Rapidithrix thailandica TaxID=413964 RepID=A0AAW9S9V8_9BACT
MPLPELNLSLSITDNPGSPLYAGNGEREKMGEFDSRMNQHRIIITISDEQVGETTLSLDESVAGESQSISLPTYKMTLTDDKTEETTFYEVIRDKALIHQVQTKEVGGLSFFGKKLFASKATAIEAIAFEPQKDTIQSFRASKNKTLKKDYLYYTLKQDQKTAYLMAGTLTQDVLANKHLEYLFYVVDQRDGDKFIGDILYREKFMKLTPEVEVRLIKRKKVVKEILFRKNKANKIIYI